MLQLSFAKIKPADLKALVQLNLKDVAAYPWTLGEDIVLNDREHDQLQDIQMRLLQDQPHLMNEATLWSRAIYPLLLLAESAPIRAWAEVELQANYARFSLTGVADGVVGKCLAGEMQVPYLVVIEAKRGLEAQDPKYPLYGQLLAAAHLNWETELQEPQEIFGCYTIADAWTFIRGEVSEIQAEKPRLTLEFSREYVEKLEAETILRILKGIVTKFT